MPAARPLYDWPQTADRYYRIVDGREDVEVVHETDRTLVIRNPEPSAKADVDLLIIPKAGITSLATMDLSDALRWIDAWESMRAAAKKEGLGHGHGFRLDIPVHPPFQQSPWLTMRLRHRKAKQPKAGCDEHGYNRDIGHFASVCDGRRRVEVLYENEHVLVFEDPEDEDHREHEHVLVAITRKPIESLLDHRFGGDQWLALTAAFVEGAARVGLDAYAVYLNVLPPYQHTPWVHAHVLSGPPAED